jgi:hypothetical protein
MHAVASMASYLKTRRETDNPALAAATAAIRRAIEDHQFPRAPRLDPLRAVLAKLDAGNALLILARSSFPVHFIF